MTEAIFPPTSIQKVLTGLSGGDLLIKLDWDEWLEVNAPYDDVSFTQKDVFTRFNRNGYDWDIQGILYRPSKEIDSKLAIVFFHGGAGSSYGKDTTPDGRAGLPRILATSPIPAIIRRAGPGRKVSPSASPCTCWTRNSATTKSTTAI